MQHSTKVLVVGTTADYIEWIRRSCPGRALFVTDPMVRSQAQEPQPTAAEEIVCDLSDYAGVRAVLKRHLSVNALRLNGIVSYDCESMELAAILAHDFALPYPSVQAVKNCRDKYLSKLLWQKHGLHTPNVCRVRSPAEAVSFFQETGGSCVLKPLNGSGSELIFRCDSEQACETGFQRIIEGLRQRRTNRLYRSFFYDGPVILAEEYVQGNEFSCDFIIEKGSVSVIRFAAKIIAPTGPFGTARAYLLAASPPDEIDEQDLPQTLYKSAAALGLNRALCMLDFMVQDGRIILLELAPRPGGDCLPFVLRRCWNLDVLKLFIDFSQQRPLRMDKPSDLPTCLGLRVHAPRGGILKRIDAGELCQNGRIREIYLPRKPGHLIKMPPEDYDSWLLGHIIVEPDGQGELEAQCRTLVDKLVVEIE